MCKWGLWVLMKFWGLWGSCGVFVRWRGRGWSPFFCWLENATPFIYYSLPFFLFYFFYFFFSFIIFLKQLVFFFFLSSLCACVCVSSNLQ